MRQPTAGIGDKIGGEIDCRIDKDTNIGATDGDRMTGDNMNDGVDNEM